MVKQFLAAFTLFSALAATAQTGTYCIENRFSESAMFDSSQVTVTKNVVYSVPKKWPGTGVDTLKLDLYYPSASAENLAKRPAIVFLYGGAWIKGSKNDADIQQKCFEWARRGFVVAAPNYRLGWNCPATDLLGVCVYCQGNYYDLPTALYRGAQDAKAALRFMVANQNSYKIDTAAIFIGGESAGSFNAHHAAHWTHTYAKNLFNSGPYKILGSVDSAGGNIGVPFRVRGVISNCGAVLNDTSLKLKPLPTVFFHDESDCVVPYQINRILNCCATSFAYAKGASNMYNELDKAGVSAELHHIAGITPAHCSYPSLTLVKESSCFIKKILCALDPNGSIAYPTTPAVSCNALKAVAGVVDISSSIQCSPVPVDNSLNIQFNGIKKCAKIEIINSMGQKVETAVIPAGNGFVIETADLISGTYSIKMLWDDGHVANKKIVVLHP